jgi:hypothetical protein
LAVDANGRVHVAYHGADTEDLKYATCPGDCDTPVNWQDTRVDGRGLTPYIVGRDPSLAVDGGGRLHVSYRVVDTNDLKYATCEVDCDQAANWQTVTVDAVGAVGFGSTLAVDANGRIHVSYPDNGGQELRYATCAADCELAAGWETTAWETAAGGGVGATSLAVAGNGSVHIAYRDTGVPSGALAYVQ